MKKYLLFQYDYHDSRGGLFDVHGSYDTPGEAENDVSKEYWHVVDRHSLECVAGNDRPPTP